MPANDNNRMSRCQRLDRLASVLDLVLSKNDESILLREYERVLQEAA